jgi:hypothetical protein
MLVARPDILAPFRPDALLAAAQRILVTVLDLKNFIWVLGC